MGFLLLAAMICRISFVKEPAIALAPEIMHLTINYVDRQIYEGSSVSSQFLTAIPIRSILLTNEYGGLGSFNYVDQSLYRGSFLSIVQLVYRDAPFRAIHDNEALGVDHPNAGMRLIQRSALLLHRHSH